MFARRLPDSYGHKLKGSKDGKAWTPLVNRSAAPQDAPHDYVQRGKSVMVRYARITSTHSPAGVKFSLSGLRLFGSGLGRVPQAASGVQVVRGGADGRQAVISWQPVPGVDGYVVRYGIAPDKLFSSYQVYGASTLSIHTLNVGVPYYFAVDTFGSSGVTHGKTVTSG